MMEPPAPSTLQTAGVGIAVANKLLGAAKLGQDHEGSSPSSWQALLASEGAPGRRQREGSGKTCNPTNRPMLPIRQLSNGGVHVWDHAYL